MKPKDTPKQYVIYSRKSKFTGKGESIENQIELCRQYIAMHFGEDAAENVLVYEDEGFSGGNLERPQFKKMMKDSQKIAFAAIVVYRLDRISRNIGDFAKLIESQYLLWAECNADSTAFASGHFDGDIRLHLSPSNSVRAMRL